jgi:hypothetical protein
MHPVSPRAVVLALALSAVACSNAVGEEEKVASTGDQSSSVSSELSSYELIKQLGELKLATAKYRNVNVALAEGFQNWNGPVCEPSMGYHFVNINRVLAPPDRNNPSILLYDNDGNGGYTLVGVEYMVPVIVNGQPYFAPKEAPPPPDAVKDTPRLFDRNFDGPMPGHSPSMPWHWDMHVYIWRLNPNGIFTPLNPRVCN